MHAGGGVPAACESIGKIVHRIWHKAIVVSVHVNIGATEVVFARVAHGEVWDPVRGAHESDIPSRFVASKCSQGVDVQLNCLDDRPALRRFDAVAD